MERKEAIEVIKKNWPDSSFTMLREALETLVPELKESEDEKIRKALYKMAKVPRKEIYEAEGITKEQALAWFEKQAEQKPIIIPKFRVGDIIRNIKYPTEIYKISKVEKWCYVSGQTDYTSIRILITDQDKWELVEQKHVKEQIFPKWTDEEEFYIVALEGLVKDRWRKAEQENDDFNVKKMSDLSFFLKTLKKPEWSEKDIEMIDWLIRCCEKEHEELCNDKYGHQEIVSDLKRDCRKKWDWLESLKNRAIPQPKQEWSEEDERHKNTIIRAIHGAGNITPIEGELAEKWLKSLRHQNRWKPSEEQMKALKRCVDGWHSADGYLESLYDDLKAL